MYLKFDASRSLPESEKKRFEELFGNYAKAKSELLHFFQEMLEPQILMEPSETET